jgi:hypothetical protein
MLHPDMLLARLTGVLALVLLFGSVVAMVLAGPVKHPLAKKDASFVHARLLSYDQDVRAQLVRVRAPSTGIVRAQRVTRDAVTEIAALGRVVNDVDGTTAQSLRLAIAQELRFLDAVGSVLLNRHSPLVTDLSALDTAARRAIAAVDGPRQRRSGGVKALLRLRGTPLEGVPTTA